MYTVWMPIKRFIAALDVKLASLDEVGGTESFKSTTQPTYVRSYMYMCSLVTIDFLIFEDQLTVRTHIGFPVELLVEVLDV